MTSHVVPHGLAQPCSTALLLSTFISCLNPRPPATREILSHTRAHSLKHTAPKHVQRHTHTDTQRSVFNKFFSSDKAKIKMPWQSVRACAFLCVQLKRLMLERVRCAITWNYECRVQSMAGGSGSRGDAVQKPKRDGCTSTRMHTWTATSESSFNLMGPIRHRATPSDNLLAQSDRQTYRQTEVISCKRKNEGN